MDRFRVPPAVGPGRRPALAALLTALLAISPGNAGATDPAADPAPAPTNGAAVPASPEVSRAAFERFKALAGSWVGESSKGWTEDVSYRVIANGSAVMELSFDAHPDETMVSMIHPDGDRLLLTHYCAARNQPRLVLTSASPDLSEMTFEFLDGTNLVGRDQGHMDKVVWRFPGDDEFSSRWTWYQDGKESWMEDIRYVRSDRGKVPTPAEAGAAGGGP